MKPNDVVYQDRIVIFLDLLGFEEEIKNFENEAVEYGQEHGHFISKKANKFLRVFKDVLTLINDRDCNSYLFTDNICITVDPERNQSLWIDIFFTISDLFQRFAEIGYFLRGGIDYGLMLDENDIAIGMPLINTYKVEREIAFFPRIVVSKQYIDFLGKLDLDENQISLKKNFLISSCEVIYLNPFYNIIKKEDKIGFFKKYNRSIKRNLKDFAMKERVFIKHNWLKDEFNVFLDNYIENMNVLDPDNELDDVDIEQLKKLRIR